MAHGEGQPLGRHAGQHQDARLAGLDFADVAFIDLEHHPVTVQRRQLEQGFALFDRSPDGLGQITADQHPVKRRDDAGAGQALVHLIELGLGFGHLGGGHRLLGALMSSQGFVALLLLLGALGRQLRALQPQIAVVQTGQQGTLHHALAGTRRGLDHKAFKRRGDHPLHLAFQGRACRHPVRRVDQRQRSQQRQACQGGDGKARAAAVGQRRPAAAQQGRALARPPVRLIVQPGQHRGQHHCQGLALGDEFRGQRGDRHLPGHSPHRPGAGQDRHGQRGLIARQRVLGIDHQAAVGAGGLRPGQRGALLNRLTHRGFNRRCQRAAALKPGRMRERTQPHPAALHQPHRHPLTATDARQFGGHGGAGVVHPIMAGQQRQHVQRLTCPRQATAVILGSALAKQGVDPAGTPLNVGQQAL